MGKALSRRKSAIYTDPFRKWRDLLRYRQVWAIVLARFLVDPVWWLYITWLPLFLYQGARLRSEEDRNVRLGSICCGGCGEPARRIHLGLSNQAWLERKPRPQSDYRVCSAVDACGDSGGSHGGSDDGLA